MVKYKPLNPGESLKKDGKPLTKQRVNFFIMKPQITKNSIKMA